MPLYYQKYVFPNICCNTYNLFQENVKKYLHTLTGSFYQLFLDNGLDYRKIHKRKEDKHNVDILVAPFCEDNQFGIMGYGKEGVALMEKWLEIARDVEGETIKDVQVERLCYTFNFKTDFDKYIFYTYKTEFWIPINRLKFNAKTNLYTLKTKHGELLADFVGNMHKSITQFFLKTKTEMHALTHLKDEAFVVIQDFEEIDKNSYGYKKVFKGVIKSNIPLPKYFHLGQDIGKGFGFFVNYEK